MTDSRPDAPPAAAPRAMRLAYLTTEYPKVSHTFIRREILELERRGHSVLRLAIRDSAGAVADPADAAEEEKTFHCLRQSKLRLLWDAAIVKISNIPAWIRAAGKMWSMSRRSDRGLVRHIAYLVEAASLLRVVRRERIEHLHVHFGTNAAAVARLMRALGGPPYSMTVHGPDEFDAPSGFSLSEKVADSAFTVAITDYCAAQLRRWADPDDWHRIRVVHCTVADDFFAAAQPVPAESRRLVCVGRLSAQKGQFLLLDAAKRLVDAGVELHLVFAGDGELRPRIERRIAELHLQNHVTITGWISEHAVREALLASRGLVLPSFAEGLPVVIMEAMALQRPVLCTRITGIPELVRDGLDGWLITAGSVDQLADAMRDMLASPPNRLNAMGCSARARVRDRHAVASQIERLEALFARAVAQGGRS